MRTLSEYAIEYVRRLDLSEGYQRQLVSCANSVSLLLARTALVKDLTVETINLVIRNPRIKRSTRGNRRRMLLTLAADAARANLIERIDPFFVDRVRKDKTLPNGYSWDQAFKIVNFVRNHENSGGIHRKWMDSTYSNGITRKDWWFAYLLGCWDTGHFSDLLRLTLSEMDMNGRITRLRNKTGKLIQAQLSSPALHAAHKIRIDGSRLVYPRWCNCKNKKCIGEEYRRIANESGVGGYLKYFRSGAGTAVENDNPGRGNVFLSNTRRTFEDHYLVPQHLTSREPLRPKPLLSDAG